MKWIQLDTKDRYMFLLGGMLGFLLLLLPWQSFKAWHIGVDVIMILVASYAISAGISGELTYSLKED